jgi:predicted negative regulator of RcsB-dependent stress response
MARKQAGTIEALDEIQGAADHLAEWIREHLGLVLGVVGGLLALAGGISFYMTSQTGREQDAASALALAREEYLEAMGAGPGAFEVPELANPEAGARIRSEYAEKLANVAATYSGTVASTLAELDQAALARDAGEPERALEILEASLAGGVTGEALRGVTLQRVAQGLEDLGRWEDAATRHEEAAAIRSFPLRHWALADAARCAARAGDRQRALALYERVEAEAPDLRLPDHQRAEIRELRASAPQ